jgi:hypothetical protein
LDGVAREPLIAGVGGILAGSDRRTGVDEGEGVMVEDLACVNKYCNLVLFSSFLEYRKMIFCCWMNISGC